MLIYKWVIYNCWMCWRKVSCSECFWNHRLQLRESSKQFVSYAHIFGIHTSSPHLPGQILKRSEGHNILFYGIWNSWALQFSPPEHLITVAGWATQEWRALGIALSRRHCFPWSHAPSGDSRHPWSLWGHRGPASSLPRLGMTPEGRTNRTASTRLFAAPVLAPFLPYSCFPPELLLCVQALSQCLSMELSLVDQNLWRWGWKICIFIKLF